MDLLAGCQIELVSLFGCCEQLRDSPQFRMMNWDKFQSIAAHRRRLLCFAADQRQPPVPLASAFVCLAARLFV